MILSKSEDLSGLRQIEEDKLRCKNIIRSHHDFLVDQMSLEFGLIDNLYSNDALSILQKNKVEMEPLSQQKNDILLKYVVEENICEKLFEALKLKKYGQSHLVNFMEANGAHDCQKFQENWPLKEKETRTLKKNFENLIDLLDSNQLVALLYQRDVLNQRQRDEVWSKRTTAEQNKVLLEILRKGSLDGYKKMIDCLNHSNQSHIAEIFESGSDVVRIDTNIPPPLLDMKESSIKSEISKSSEHLNVSCILTKKKQNLKGAAGTGSVAVYFLLFGPGDIDRTKHMSSDGQLKRCVDDTFSRLMSTMETLTSRNNAKEAVRFETRSLPELSSPIQNCIETDITRSLQNVDVSFPLMKKYQNLERLADTDAVSINTLFLEPDDNVSAGQMAAGGQSKTFQPLDDSWPLMKEQEILEGATDTDRDSVYTNCIEPGGIDSAEQMAACGQQSTSIMLHSRANTKVYRSKFGGKWPLAEKESKILSKNYGNLVDILDSRDLVVFLYQTGVLNRRQKDLIILKTTSKEQNKVLLEILRKGSMDGYWQTIRCLHLSNQSHIARIFDSGGVVVRIDVNIQSDLSKLIEINNSIATEITNILRITSYLGFNHMWEEVQLNLVWATATHGISLYFLCSDEGDIDRLKLKASDGQLKKFVEDLFNRLMKLPKNIKVTLNWSRHLFSKSRNYIKAIQVSNFIDEPTKTTIHCLPLEVSDTILQKAYLWSRLKTGIVNGNKDSDIIVSLASVDNCCYQRIQRKRFKKPIFPQLEKMYRREFEMNINFRGCRRYLEESIQVDEVRLMRRELVAADLTDLQIAKQHRKQTTKGERPLRRGWRIAMENLAGSRGFKKETMNNNFIRYLRQANQTKKATVLEKGKATVKLEIRRPKNSKTDAWSREFSNKLNNLKDRNQAKSEDMEMIIKQLEDSGLEILNSFVDQDVVVWIWCKSQNAVENLKALHKSKTLVDYLYRLANENDRNRNNKDIHLEEFSQRKIETISLQNLVINDEGEIHTKDKYLAIGVTKLRGKIFVLSHFRSAFPLCRKMYAVHVFDDQHPFKLQRKKKFKEIKEATDIAAYEKGFSLYIADYEVKCIWKICPPDEDKIEADKFTYAALKSSELSRFNYFGMMITDSGQIMIIGDQNSILLFCESESALNCLTRFVLPASIEQPIQVAENSAGSFIFLHKAQKSISPGDTCQISSRPNEYQWVVSEVGQNCESIIRQHVGTANDWLDPAGEAFLLVDPRGRILLADRNNHRLILLDSRLQYAGSFTLDTDGEDEENRLLLPKKMVYDAGKNQLIVVGDKKVPVYSFSKF